MLVGPRFERIHLELASITTLLVTECSRIAFVHSLPQPSIAHAHASSLLGSFEDCHDRPSMHFVALGLEDYETVYV